MATKAVVLEVPSHSSPGTTYRVWVGADGPIFCDCPAHKFHKGKAAGQRPDCKHMRAVRAGTPILDAAMAMAKLGAAATDSAETLRLLASAAGESKNRRIRFLEIQEEKIEGTWVSVTNLSRFTNLEVM